MESRKSILCSAGKLFGAIAALICAGCVSSDLSTDAKVAEEVAECLPPGTASPAAVARAIWFPNASGIGSTDALPVHVTGVLVLAGDKLWFMAWNDPEHHYDMLHVVAVLLAENIRVDRLGTSTMLVIQSGNDSYDSYELMNGGSFGSDPKATQDLYEKLRVLRLKSPSPGI